MPHERTQSDDVSAHGKDSSSHGTSSPASRRDATTPISTRRGGSWITKVSSSWNHERDSLHNIEVVRAVEEEEDPTVDWVKVLRELQVEKKRAAAKQNQKYVNRSCYLFESNTPFRESVINLVEWHWFDRIVLLLILANCCFLVLDDPVCRCSNDLDCTQHEVYQRLLYSGWDCSGWPDIHRLLDVSEVGFTVLFTCEMVIKIVARGFILHKHAFLRDGWNWIDFVVVVASLASRLPTVSTRLQVLRTVRVLRPLRTMTRIKGMRPLVNTFLRSFKALGSVLLLLFFFFGVFGILGIELLTGALRGRCFLDPAADMPPPVRAMLESQQVPYMAAPNNNVGGWNANVGLCGTGAGGAQCEPYAIDGVYYPTVCRRKKWCGGGWCEDAWVENPFDFGHGLFSYDNIGASWLVIFQVLTVEGWTEILYMYEDGYQKWGSRLFHTAWVLIGTFFVVQLALAVLANSFVLALEEERLHKAREAMDEDSLLRPTRAMARRFAMFKSKRTTSFARGLETAHSTMRQNFLSSFNFSFMEGGRSMLGHTVKRARQTGLSLWCEHNVWGPGTAGRAAHQAVQSWCRRLVRAPYFSRAIIAAILLNTLCLALDFHDQARYESELCRRRCELDPDIPAGLEPRCGGPLFNRTFDSDGRGGGVRPVQTAFCFMDDSAGPVKGPVQCAGHQDQAACVGAGGGGACWWFGAGEVRCRRGLYSGESFAESRAGRLGLRQLCGDGLEQCQTFPEERQEVFERINAVLTFLFISEMALKMVGLGFLEYFDDQFNQFDFFVVTASIIELVYNAASSGSSSGSTISALRGMRLFRLFKLARSWKSMRKILRTLAVALGSLGPLTLIWVMFMYIFALLNMQYFGGTFRAIKTDSPRSNFDSFFPSKLGHGAFLVTFQIITSENWNTIAYNSIATAHSALGALPSILIVLFGNYIIMNLFISILLQGFSDDGFDDDDHPQAPPADSTGPRPLVASLFRRLLGRSVHARTSALEQVVGGEVLPAEATATLREDSEAVARATATMAAREQAASTRGTQERVMQDGSLHLVRTRDQAGHTPPATDHSPGQPPLDDDDGDRKVQPSSAETAARGPDEIERVRPFSQPPSEHIALASAANSPPRSPTPGEGGAGRVAGGSPMGLGAVQGLASASKRELAALDFDSDGAGGQRATDSTITAAAQELASHAQAKQESDSAARRSVTFAGGAGSAEGAGSGGVGGGMVFTTRFMRQIGAEDLEEVEVTWLNRTFALPNHTSFFVLSPSNVVRKTVARVVSSPAFDNFILLCILITSVTLIIEAPDDTILADACPSGGLDCSGLPYGQTEQVNCPREQEADFGRVWAACGEDGEAACCATKRKMAVLQQMDVVFTMIFTVEMALKMLVEGLVFHRRAYLRDGWNLLDAAIVAIAWVTTFAPGLGGISNSIKALRAIRALRPLRVIKRNPGLRVAVVCLLSSIPAMLNVGVVVVLWFSMYAMLGVQLFKGELYRCYDLEKQVFYGATFDALGTFFTQEQRLSGPASVPTIVECVSRTAGGGSWEDRDYSFNSYPQALLTLFEMATTEGWMSVMAAVVDGVAPGVSPVPNYRPWYALFCVVHLIIGAFVLLNLIVGSIINNYNRIKNFGDSHGPFLTREQQDWIDTQKLVNHLKPRRRKQGPKNPFRAFMYRIAIHPWFDYGVTCCIVGNMLAMMTRTHHDPPCYRAAMFFINLFFTTVFVVEAAVKLTGLGFRWYFMDGWNRFDLLVTLLALVTTVLSASNREFSCQANAADSVPALQILRSFRIARVFRLIRRARGLKQMIQTLIISLPALGNIGALILLFITIFAVLGNAAFYNTNLDQDLYGHLDANGNYRTFDNAFFILFRQTTGEAWNGIMYYCFQTDPYKACDKRYGEYLGSGCGGPLTGLVYHVLWQLFGTYVLMQLFTAVILENFDDLAREDMSVVPIDKLQHFVDVWTEFDPHAREKIKADRFPDLIGSLPPPLGVKGEHGATAPPTRTDLMLVIKDLPIPIYNGSVRYRDTFLGCVKRVIALELSQKAAADQPSPDADSFGAPRRASTGGAHSSHHSVNSTRSNNFHSAARSPPPNAGSTPTFRGRAPTVAEDYAARTVQLAFREFKEKRLQVSKGQQRTQFIPLFPHDEAVITW